MFSDVLFRCFIKLTEQVAVTLNYSDCIQFLSLRYMSNPHTNTETMDKEYINMSETLAKYVFVTC